MNNKAIEGNLPSIFAAGENDCCDSCAVRAYCFIPIADIVAELCMDSEPTCMALMPDGATCIMTVEDAEESFGNMSYHAVVHNDDVFLACDPNEIVTLGGVQYLTHAALIFEIDDEGNECCITADTVSNAMEFFEDCAVDIEVDGRFFPAIRLD